MIATFVLNTGSPIAVVCGQVTRELAVMIISYNSLGKARWRKNRKVLLAAPQKRCGPMSVLKKRASYITC
jgi:hypothetical protein